MCVCAYGCLWVDRNASVHWCMGVTSAPVSSASARFDHRGSPALAPTANLWPRTHAAMAPMMVKAFVVLPVLSPSSLQVVASGATVAGRGVDTEKLLILPTPWPHPPHTIAVKIQYLLKAHAPIHYHRNTTLRHHHHRQRPRSSTNLNPHPNPDPNPNANPNTTTIDNGREALPGTISHLPYPPYPTLPYPPLSSRRGSPCTQPGNHLAQLPSLFVQHEH